MPNELGVRLKAHTLLIWRVLYFPKSHIKNTVSRFAYDLISDRDVSLCQDAIIIDSTSDHRLMLYGFDHSLQVNKAVHWDDHIPVLYLCDSARHRLPCQRGDNPRHLCDDQLCHGLVTADCDSGALTARQPSHITQPAFWINSPHIIRFGLLIGAGVSSGLRPGNLHEDGESNPYTHPVQIRYWANVADVG